MIQIVSIHLGEQTGLSKNISTGFPLTNEIPTVVEKTMNLREAMEKTHVMSGWSDAALDNPQIINTSQQDVSLQR